jgi:omega-hydroxy-beta-dihydromenaquinone-9 sulfotransferase
MSEKKNSNVQHPLFAVSTRRWMRLLAANGGVDPGYRTRAVFISVMSMATVPVRFWYNIRYRRRVASTTLKYPPVFIIGHWRSGTTYLHELMSQDPQFCHVSLWETMLPDSFLAMEPWKGFLAGFLPATRPMDNIEVAMDGPYEDEAALAVLCPWSFFHCLYFPRNAEEQYLKSIHFQGLSPEEKGSWEQAYLDFLKGVTYASEGRRLLSKNPPNTARISTLVRLFPDAKFIYIVRDPYLVYLSTRKMRRNVLGVMALQHASEQDLDRQVLENYVRLLDVYLKERDLVPRGNLVEVRYEDLVADPAGEVKKIYSSLGLPFDQALPGIQQYLDRKTRYKTNEYSLDPAMVKKVNEAWGFAFDQWKYPRRGER